MRRYAIHYMVAALLVGLLAACGQKPDDFRTHGTHADDADFHEGSCA